MTLLELFISTSLAAVLAGSLFWSYRLSTSSAHEREALLWQVTASGHLAYQLERLFSEIENGIFYTSDERTLTFFYNNGVDEERAFCGTVLGRLYQDAAGNLCLATWPDPRHWSLEPMPCRFQLLQPHTTNLCFRFFDTPQWSSSWSKNELPALVQLQIDGERYTYPLHAANKPIVSKMRSS